MQKYFLLFSFLFLTTLSFAQTGTIKGQIIDSTLNEGVIGANVVIEGTQIGGSTDIDGNYIISSLQPGTYNLVITYIGYKTKQISGVVVYAGKITTVNSFLKEDSGQLQDVVITAERETYSEISVISEIKLSPVVAVGVSGEQISKTQDSDGAAVLRRLPGISLFDERFIMVRGLGERYNAVLLNGALTPSTEVDVKSFSFDVIPSSVIDRMLVLKSGAPHLPGEYAGGIIQIFTKNAPDENFTNLSVTGGYRVGTTFNEMLKYEGGKTDWLGFDDGTRKLPDNFPSTSEINASNTAGVAAAQQLSSTWLPVAFNAAPDFKISLGLGRRFRIGNTRVGNLTSISYGNSRQFLKIDRNRYGFFDPETQTIDFDLFRYNDEQSNQTVRIGAIHNWSLTFNKDNKIEFRNLFNQLGSTQTSFRQGLNGSNNSQVNNYSLYYENKSIYSGQLAGQHNFGKSSFDWLGGFSYTNRQEPDFRRYISYLREDQYLVQVPNGFATQQNGRFFSKLNEYVFTLATNYEYKFGKSEADENGITLKVGAYVERKIRDYSARELSLSTSATTGAPFEGTADFIFDPANLNTNAYFLRDGTLERNRYNASNSLFAGYASVNIPFSDKWNLITGVRFEYNDQRLDSEAPGAISGVSKDRKSVV